MFNVALPKGRLGEQVIALFDKIGCGCPGLLGDGGRKLVYENPESKMRFFLVKPGDVGVYVESGAADIGVAGKDILLEQRPAVYELLDLGLGKCRMAVAAKNGFSEDMGRALRVATKFVNIAEAYYAGKSREIEIIKLHGSIELAPICGLSDVIVDIVETGVTLRENDLSVIEEVTPISARLIANPSSYRFKNKAVGSIAERLREVL